MNMAWPRRAAIAVLAVVGCLFSQGSSWAQETPAAPAPGPKFATVHTKMTAALASLRAYRLTLTEEAFALESSFKSIHHIEHASPSLYRIKTELPKRPGMPDTRIVTCDGKLVIVAQVTKHKPVYFCYVLEKMPAKDRLKFESFIKVAPQRFDKPSLKQFKFVGFSTMDGGEVVQYHLPPRKLDKPKGEAIPGISDGPATTTGSVAIWISTQDYLPRRLVMTTPSGRPGIVRTYANIDLKPRLSRKAFSCELPRKAYIVDMTDGM